MAKRRGKTLKTILLLLLVAIVAVGAGGYIWVQGKLKPQAPGKNILVRFAKRTPLRAALRHLQEKGVVRDAEMWTYYARYKKRNGPIRSGTYSVRAGMTPDEVFDALTKPVRMMVRLPETHWAARTANLLEEKRVAKAKEYMDLVKSPEAFREIVDFPLPKDSLEGVLLPDTYDLPPLLGARGVIERQLAAFETKVWKELGQPKDLKRVLTVASMVELEVQRGEERPLVAGVIENRLKKGMPLQIDATINYALGVWRPLTVAEYRSVKSPYNTYLQPGLPPGPICSPSVASIKAALNPAKHDYIYYVAMPDGRHIFSRTYAEHLANIARRRAALRGTG